MSEIIIIAGPTASGKTKLAIELADTLKGEIISADSRQIYQGIDIGTGKPDEFELQKTMHHLISFVNPRQTFTADDFSQEARRIYFQILKRKKLCMVVGGTGLWIRAFIDGLAPSPPPDKAFRDKLKIKARSEGLSALYNELAEKDPETAARLPPGDEVRIIRSLEIIRQTGMKASQIRSRAPESPSLPARWLGLEVPRAELYRRAEHRIEQWLAQGWLAEVSRLLQAGVPAEAPAMQAIGYSHLVRHLHGEFGLERAVELIKRDTRRYIKRQFTWFRAEKRMEWVAPDAGRIAEQIGRF